MLLHRCQNVQIALYTAVVVVPDHLYKLVTACKPFAVVPFSFQDPSKAFHRAVVDAPGNTGHTEYLTIYTVVIGFYFGTQSQKKSGAERSRYVGPEQSLPVYETVDAAVANDVHPPDVTAKVGFEY